MIEDELRSAFARHEEQVPDPLAVRQAITAGIRRRQRRALARSTALAALVVAIVAVPAALVARGAGDRGASDGRNASGAGTTSQRAGQASTDGPRNLLILGLDRRPGSTEPARADTVMVAHLDGGHDRAYLLSFPRDTLVEGAGPYHEKINAGYARGGVAETVREVSEITGIRIDGTVTVDFAGLVKLVDAVGGVDMCVPLAVRSGHTGRWYVPGCHHFTGEQALDYVRQRFTLPGGDLDRAANTRDLLRAIMSRLTSQGVLADPRRVAAVLAAAGDAVRLDLGEHQLAEALALVDGLSTKDLVGITVPTEEAETGNSPFTRRLTPDAAGLFAALRGDDLDAWAQAHPQAVR